ncbi:hypothetical protein LAP67_004464 [Salmonella enterica]|nr:hypothetical protein [Salmonella enterica]
MPYWSFLPDFPGVILLVSSHLQGTLSQQQNRDVAPDAYLLVVSMDCNSPQFEFCAVFPACQRTGGAPQFVPGFFNTPGRATFAIPTTAKRIHLWKMKQILHRETLLHS